MRRSARAPNLGVKAFFTTFSGLARGLKTFSSVLAVHRVRRSTAEQGAKEILSLGRFAVVHSSDPEMTFERGVENPSADKKNPEGGGKYSTSLCVCVI